MIIDENEIARIVVDKCFHIHKTLGPGLLESIYEEILLYELVKDGLDCDHQMWLPVIYDGHTFHGGFRADIIVNGKLIIELKSVKSLLPVHKKQLLTYLKITDMKLGLLINFNVELMKQGIIRVVNNL